MVLILQEGQEVWVPADEARDAKNTVILRNSRKVRVYEDMDFGDQPAPGKLISFLL